MQPRVHEFSGRLLITGLQGKHSKDFAADLGYIGSAEIVHRDNIAMLSLTEQSKQQISAAQQASMVTGSLLSCSACTD